MQKIMEEYGMAVVYMVMGILLAAAFGNVLSVVSGF